MGELNKAVDIDLPNLHCHWKMLTEDKVSDSVRLPLFHQPHAFSLSFCSAARPSTRATIHHHNPTTNTHHTHHHHHHYHHHPPSTTKTEKHDAQHWVLISGADEGTTTSKPTADHPL